MRSSQAASGFSGGAAPSRAAGPVQACGPGDSTHLLRSLLQGLKGHPKALCFAPSRLGLQPGAGTLQAAGAGFRRPARGALAAASSEVCNRSPAQYPSTPTPSLSPPGGLFALPSLLPLPLAYRNRVCAYILGCVTRLGRPPGSAPLQTVCKAFFYKCKTHPSSRICL